MTRDTVNAVDDDRTATHFLRDEDGAFSWLAVVLTLSTFMVAGLSLDYMQAETARMRLQETADRAALAAASSTQDRDRYAVVNDYFTAAGLGNVKKDVSITPLNGGAEVQIVASDSIDATFLRMVGIEQWNTRAEAIAIEAINKVEISLVLDVSGSMGDNNRLRNLKNAASDFVNKIFDESTDDGVTVSVIPYSSQVVLSNTLASQFSIPNRPSGRTCIDFENADFTETGIPVGRAMKQTGSFDPYAGYSSGRGPYYSVCPDDSRNEILAFSGDRSEILDAIDDLRASGDTGIDNGMKWGVALLDPAAKPVLQGLVGTGEVDGTFIDRPYAYSDPNVMKIVVLMTDGQNTTQYKLRPEYQTGMSDFWWHNSSQRFSLQAVPPSNSWFRCSLDSYKDYYVHNSWGTRYCQTSGSTRNTKLYYAPHNDYWYSDPYGGNSASRLSWVDLWERSSVDYVAYMRYLATRDADDYYDNRWTTNDALAADRNGSITAPMIAVSYQEKDDRLIAMCDAAKAQDMMVFTIGFEAPKSSANMLEECASGEPYAFDVEGLDINFAFNAIASSINTLRLTK